MKEARGHVYPAETNSSARSCFGAGIEGLSAPNLGGCFSAASSDRRLTLPCPEPTLVLPTNDRPLSVVEPTDRDFGSVTEFGRTGR